MHPFNPFNVDRNNSLQQMTRLLQQIHKTGPVMATSEVCIKGILVDSELITTAFNLAKSQLGECISYDVDKRLVTVT